MRRFRPRPAVIAGAVMVALLAPVAAPAAANADYGAIAVNPKTGAAGWSWGINTQDRAKRKAERKCRGRCKTVVWVRNGCAAVVKTRRRYVPGIGKSKRKALRKARKRAHNRRAPKVAWICSG